MRMYTRALRQSLKPLTISWCRPSLTQHLELMTAVTLCELLPGQRYIVDYKQGGGEARTEGLFVRLWLFHAEFKDAWGDPMLLFREHVTRCEVVPFRSSPLVEITWFLYARCPYKASKRGQAPANTAAMAETTRALAEAATALHAAAPAGLPPGKRYQPV